VEEHDGDVRLYRLEVERWLFRSLTMKDMQYNLAMGHIPRSTERRPISSFFLNDSFETNLRIH